MARDTFRLTIQEEGSRKRVSLTLLLTKRKRATTVALAVAIAGLVILLALQIAPPLGKALVRLLSGVP